MNKSDLANAFKSAQTLVSKHSPALLTGIGIAGMLITVVSAVKATPKALDLIEDKKEELELQPDEKLTPIETVKATWKCYVPAAVTGIASTACLIGANSVNTRRNAALATAYNLSTTALAEYKEKVIDTIGERKEQTIRSKIAEDKLKKEPADRAKVIVTGAGTTRFYDDISKRRFMSSIDKIKNARNDLNARMLEGEDFISLNDFYYELGLEPIGYGDDVGWNVYNGRRGMIAINLDSAIVDTDGEPCIVLEYDVAPERGYR
jgi:hypothetical protein